MSAKIVFRCPGCDAKISAPIELFGKERTCPGCSTAFIVRAQHSPTRARPVVDSDPLLVAYDDSRR